LSPLYGLLEWAQKSPTLGKIDALVENMEIQPLTLLTLTYLYAEPEQDIGQLLEKTKREIARILNN